MRLGVFGALEASHDGESVRVGRRLERCLFGILLLADGREVPLDRIIGLLWDEHPPNDPRSTLHTYVSRLRTALTCGSHGVAMVPLVRCGSGYRAEPAGAAVDVLRFKSLVDGTRGLADPVKRAKALRAAVALRRGPVLDADATNAVRQQITAAWDESWLAAVEDAIDAELACGMHRELVAELTRLSGEHPYRERFTALLMRALHRSGRTADALAAYSGAAARLGSRLGIGPGAELRGLRASLACGERV